LELSSQIGQRYLGIINTREKTHNSGGGEEGGGGGVDDGGNGGVLNRIDNHRECDTNKINDEKIENNKSSIHSIDDRMELVLDVLNDDLIEQCRKKILGKKKKKINLFFM
jgi:hypothetical protein